MATDAIGIASAVVQVLYLASELICVLKKLQNGDIAIQDDLNSQAERMSIIVTQLGYRSRSLDQIQSSEYKPKLIDIARDCELVAQELGN